MTMIAQKNTTAHTPMSKNFLLIISGGIAAYKSLYLIRLLRQRGATIRAILTDGGAQFVTPLSVSALCEHPVYTDLWSLKDEAEMGHIRLSRECDAIIVAPASADLLAKMAHGLANDLASTVLLAANKPIYVAPAMNVQMWQHPATQDNLRLLRERGVQVIDPDAGVMACGEIGPGRMVEPEIIADILYQIPDIQRPLAGKKAIVTSGPTHEPLDPVRFLGNYASGKQGHALAVALAAAGADVTLISGPVGLADPANMRVVHIQTAAEMHAACLAHLPCDIAICAAAVADWRPVTSADRKIKKAPNAGPPTIQLIENPDILHALSTHATARPRLVIGFAAETDDVVKHALDKRVRKGCDWILANDVGPGRDVFGGSDNEIHLITEKGVDHWPKMRKTALAHRLVQHISVFFKDLS